MDFNSKYKSSKIEEILDSVGGKQDVISDLEEIRQGAAKGATAIQDISGKADNTRVDLISERLDDIVSEMGDFATESQLNNKQDVITDLDTIRQGAAKGNTALQKDAFFMWEVPINDDGVPMMSGKITEEEYNKFKNSEVVFLEGVAAAREGDILMASVGQNTLILNIGILEGVCYYAVNIIAAITVETDPVFSASPAASITEVKKTEWDNKVDKVSGKQLSTEDFTSALKTKLEGLSNYDDTELSEALSTLRGDFDKLVSGDTTTAIKTFNEVISFLDGIQDTQDLSSIIASIEQQIAGKYTKPSGGIPASDLAPDVFLQGEKGDKGDKGDTGAIGPQGPQGVSVTSVVQTTTSSSDGGSNVVTVTLSDGKTSTFTVKNGSKGSQGIQGPKGDTGADGAQGPKGDKGDKGDTGATGANGTNGVSVSSVKQTTTSTADGGTNVVTVTLSNGTTSTFNVKNGSKGSNGTNGTNGTNGKDGANGATFTPSVDSAGNLSWTNNGGLTNPPTVNIKGPKGDSGEGGGGGGDSSVFITHFTVDEFASGYVEFTDEQVETIRNAARQNKIIALPTSSSDGRTGFLVSSYTYYEDELGWGLSLEIIYNGVSYSNSMTHSFPSFIPSRVTIAPFGPLFEVISVDEDGYATADSYNKDNLIIGVEGECRYLMIGEVGPKYGMTVRFFTGEDCTIDYWGNWANGVIPTIEPYTAYEMSIVYGADYTPCAVLTPFKYVE